MINIVLFQKRALDRINRKTYDFFHNTVTMTVGNVIWLEGGYIKFLPKMVVVNQMTRNYNISEYLSHALLGEEVFITCEGKGNIYCEQVTPDTSFESILS